MIDDRMTEIVGTYDPETGTMAGVQAEAEAMIAAKSSGMADAAVRRSQRSHGGEPYLKKTMAASTIAATAAATAAVADHRATRICLSNCR